jgi:hypothetical protein
MVALWAHSMKTLSITKIIFRLVLFAGASVLMIACSSNNGGPSTPSVSYYWSGSSYSGLCYSSSGQQVPPNNCSSGYYVQYGNCYSPAGQVSPMTSCSVTGNFVYNGACYSQANPYQQVPMSVCTTGSFANTNGFYWSGAACMSATTNTPVNPQYCSTYGGGYSGYNGYGGYGTGYGSSGSYNGYGAGQRCNGTYYDSSSNYYNCGPQNNYCSGRCLYTPGQQNGQCVTCP